MKPKPAKALWTQLPSAKKSRRPQRHTAAQLAEYRRIQREIHPCFLCGTYHGVNPHHSRGRAGELICIRKYIFWLCLKDHQWVENHPDEARKIGLLCAKGDWGKQ